MSIKSYSLPRTYIIRERRIFLEIYDNSQVIESRFVKVFIKQYAGEEFRFGITITKKIGKAVIRNRARRLIKEIIRKRLREFKKNIALVFVVKRNIVGKAYEEVAGDLEKVIVKAGLLQDKSYI